VPKDKDSELDEISRSLHDVRNAIRAIDGKPSEPYTPTPPEAVYCSFCGKGKSEVAVLVEGPAVFICDQCVEQAQELVRESKKRPGSSSNNALEGRRARRARPQRERYAARGAAVALRRNV